MLETYTVTLQVLNHMLAFTLRHTTEKAAIAEAIYICRKLNDGRGMVVSCKKGSSIPKGAKNGANFKVQKKNPLKVEAL